MCVFFVLVLVVCLLNPPKNNGQPRRCCGISSEWTHRVRQHLELPAVSNLPRTIAQDQGTSFPGLLSIFRNVQTQEL